MIVNELITKHLVTVYIYHVVNVHQSAICRGDNFELIVEVDLVEREFNICCAKAISSTFSLKVSFDLGLGRNVFDIYLFL